jgi:5-methylcytosine-specific restriction protein B
VTYKIVNGIFSKVCIDASFAIAQLTSKNKSVDEILDFSLQYDKFVESIEEKLVTAQQVKLDTKSGGTVLVDSISQLGNIIIKHLDGTRTYTVSKARLTKLQSVIPDLNDVNNINNQFRAVIGGSNSSAYWSVLNEIRKIKLTVPSHGGKREYSEDEKISAISKLTKADYSDYTKKAMCPYVLIIDEINRGNVSQIFGELITLIEDDKRMGNQEALVATLPYSKKGFGVPPNLYIIGTMNTADRSVEALDTALRRRFCFEEMLPQPEKILDEGKIYDEYQIDLVELLQTINKRIEKLLDKDHQIGHSFFMSVLTIGGLKHVFQYKIIPLLQEYFFGDYGKIGLVLGKDFPD